MHSRHTMAAIIIQSSGPTCRMIFTLTQIRSMTMARENATRTPHIARICPPLLMSGCVGGCSVSDILINDAVSGRLAMLTASCTAVNRTRCRRSLEPSTAETWRRDPPLLPTLEARYKQDVVDVLPLQPPKSSKARLSCPAWSVRDPPAGLSMHNPTQIRTQ